MSLLEVPVGFSAKVQSVPETPIGSRLVSLGFIPGTYVKVVRSAPLGDPRVYLVMDKLITLRNDSAREIKVVLDNNLISLSSATEGIYEVIDLFGGTAFQNKLSKMGVVEGKTVQVVAPMKIRTERGQFTVGFGIAARVLLRRL